MHTCTCTCTCTCMCMFIHSLSTHCFIDECNYSHIWTLGIVFVQIFSYRSFLGFRLVHLGLGYRLCKSCNTVHLPCMYLRRNHSIPTNLWFKYQSVRFWNLMTNACPLLKVERIVCPSVQTAIIQVKNKVERFSLWEQSEAKWSLLFASQ